MFDLVQLHETYGAALVGLIVSSMIYGITNLQMLLYYKKCEHDSSWQKYLVLVLWILDTLHLGLSAASIYGYLITNFAHPAALIESTWPMNLQMIIGGLIVTLVQWFFAYQLWTSFKNLWATISTALVSSVCLAFTAYSTSKAFHLQTFDHLQPFQWAIGLALGATACADVMIVFISCYYQFANGIVFASTNSIFTSMVIFVLTTGLLMTTLSVPSVILFVCSQTHYASLAFFWVSIRCHVTSFLAIHNVSHYVMAKDKSRSMSFHVATNATPQGPPGAIEVAVGDARSDESEPKSLVLNRSAMSSLSGSFQVPTLLVQVHRSVCRDGEMIEP